MTDIKGGWVRFDLTGRELRRTSTEFSVGLRFRVGEEVVLIEQVSFRRWVVSEASEFSQPLDDVQGVPVSIGDHSFAIFNGSEIVQYGGPGLGMRRRMWISSLEGSVFGSVGHSLVVIGAGQDMADYSDLWRPDVYTRRVSKAVVEPLSGTGRRAGTCRFGVTAQSANTGQRARSRGLRRLIADLSSAHTRTCCQRPMAGSFWYFRGVVTSDSTI